MQKNNIFSSRNILIRDRFSRRIIDAVPYESISFVCNESIMLPEKQFTNYLQASDEAKKVKYITEIYNNFSTGGGPEDKINKFFDVNELADNDAKDTRNVLEIINNYDSTINSVTQCFKCKFNADKEIQFYIKASGKSLEIILIDLYHLCFKADSVIKQGKSKGQIRRTNNDGRRKAYFAKYSKCDRCLSTIIKLSK